MKVFVIIYLSFFAFGAMAQKGNILPVRVIDGDSIPEITLSSYQVSAKRTWRSRTAYNRFKRLERKVVKVYPLAHLASQKLEEYAKELELVTSEREKKQFYKRIEEEIKLEYEGELRNLTISEGRILIKLLDRETGDTSYELVTELRGKFSAFFWQGLARLFGHNLKSVYDPKGEDKEIEFIVQRIEAGLITLK
tara:strand:- start:64758 stop:65339 length:582 start_codon:yes stop_codon:yes gene_type:complete